VFCIARSRLPFYLLPLFAPLSLAMARALPASLPRRFAPLMALWLLALIGFRFGFAHWTDPHDDRVLAAQVRALPLEKIDEIVFVDTAPRYGLGFYLGSEIERASADERERTGALGEQLRAELSEDEGCRLLLVEANEAGTLEQALERIAGSARDLGAAGTYRAFVVSDGSCRVTSS
jgi:4-amino-4-deoxy-L-arabinose transferase